MKNLLLSCLLLVVRFGFGGPASGQAIITNPSLVGGIYSNPVTTNNSAILTLAGQGANNSTSFVDTSPVGRTVTGNGNARTSTSQAKFGGSSLFFDGNNSFLSTPTTNDLNFASRSFTIEAYVYPTVANAYQAIVTNRVNSDSQSGFWLAVFNDNTFRFYASSGGGSWDVFAGQSLGAVTFNAWNHVEVVRSGNTWYFFNNGTLVSSQTNSGTIGAVGSPLLVGSDATNTRFAGYMHLRVSSTALNTANFTPPASF